MMIIASSLTAGHLISRFNAGTFIYDLPSVSIRLGLSLNLSVCPD